MQTTIAAIATPLGTGGLGVVRLSGPRAYEIAARVFVPVSGRDIRCQKGYTALLGRVERTLPDGGREMLDQAVALFFRAPKSYTGEDAVELSCHGGVAVLQETLRALLDAGAELAGPGEFSKRAVLAGKMTLTQAEGVMDLINAQTRQGAAAALSAMDGRLYRHAAAIRADLVDLAAHLAAYVDYPDEDIPQLEEGVLSDRLQQAADQLSALLQSFDTGSMIRNGIDTAIVGKPNVGKSTLMNLLAGYQRSIVTQVPGTTRDVVEDRVQLGEVTLNLADTAGIRETDDLVEQLGVQRSREKLARAQLVLALFDGSVPLDEEDRQLLSQIGDKPCIAVINKQDKAQRLDVEAVRAQIPDLVTMSAREERGVEELERAILRKLRLEKIDLQNGLLINERQRQATGRAAARVVDGLDALWAGMTYDAVAVEIDEAIAALSELTGESAGEQVIDAVFANFCVGK